MTAWAIPVIFTGGATVLCDHRIGESVAHDWKRAGPADDPFAVIVCVATLRVYVHDSQREAFERWAALTPTRALRVDPAPIQRA